MIYLIKGMDRVGKTPIYYIKGDDNQIYTFLDGFYVFNDIPEMIRQYISGNKKVFKSNALYSIELYVSKDSEIIGIFNNLEELINKYIEFCI